MLGNYKNGLKLSGHWNKNPGVAITAYQAPTAEVELPAGSSWAKHKVLTCALSG